MTPKIFVLIAMVWLPANDGVVVFDRQFFETKSRCEQQAYVGYGRLDLAAENGEIPPAFTYVWHCDEAPTKMLGWSGS